MIKILLISALLVFALSNSHLNIKYRSFLEGEGVFDQLIAKQIYGEFRSPFTAKSQYRFKVFVATLIEVRNHNVGKHSWKQGLNDYSDMTYEQFKADRLMLPQNCSATNMYKVKADKQVNVPESYEWNSFGMVSPVKNQGSCGSCWAFSTVGTMQSHWNILGKGKNITFSEQQLVDCAGDFDNHGCQGGLPSHAFQYIRYANGIQSDVTYQYTAKNGNCNYRPSISIGYARFGSYNITQGDEAQLAERLYNAGPIAVSFQVVAGFRNYVSGVYKVDNCGKGTQDINHAVLATGYGVDNGTPFWNIKNSWGPAWGSQGYFKMLRNSNMCAISQCNSYPLIDKPKADLELKH